MTISRIKMSKEHHYRKNKLVIPFLKFPDHGQDYFSSHLTYNFQNKHETTNKSKRNFQWSQKQRAPINLYTVQ